MGWFTDTIYWDCLECKYDRNPVINNPGMHSCKRCGGEYYVTHSSTEITITAKQQWIEEQSYVLSCPACQRVEFKIRIADEGDILICDRCKTVYKVITEEDGDSIGLQSLRVQEMRHDQEIVDFQNNLNEMFEEFNALIGDLFAISVCSQCDDKSHSLLRFNERYTSANIQCNTCSKKMWITSVSNHTDNLKNAHESIVGQIADLKAGKFLEMGLIDLPEIVFIASVLLSDN